MVGHCASRRQPALIGPDPRWRQARVHHRASCWMESRCRALRLRRYRRRAARTAWARSLCWMRCAPAGARPASRPERSRLRDRTSAGRVSGGRNPTPRCQTPGPGRRPPHAFRPVTRVAGYKRGGAPPAVPPGPVDPPIPECAPPWPWTRRIHVRKRPISGDGEKPRPSCRRHQARQHRDGYPRVSSRPRSNGTARSVPSAT